MNPQLWWYFARASGMVAAILLVASLVWGVLMATRALRPVDKPAWKAQVVAQAKADGPGFVEPARPVAGRPAVAAGARCRADLLQILLHL